MLEEIDFEWFEIGVFNMIKNVEIKNVLSMVVWPLIFNFVTIQC